MHAWHVFVRKTGFMDYTKVKVTLKYNREMRTKAGYIYTHPNQGVVVWNMYLARS